MERHKAWLRPMALRKRLRRRMIFIQAVSPYTVPGFLDRAANTVFNRIDVYAAHERANDAIVARE